MKIETSHPMIIEIPKDFNLHDLKYDHVYEKLLGVEAAAQADATLDQTFCSMKESLLENCSYITHAITETIQDTVKKLFTLSALSDEIIDEDKDQESIHSAVTVKISNAKETTHRPMTQTPKT